MINEEDTSIAQWRIRHRATGEETLAHLFTYWEVEGDSISDQYTPALISAHDLLAEWVRQRTRQKGLVPIRWYVKASDLLEFMPFQHTHVLEEPRENFLTFYNWPVNPQTGDQLNWLTLPVADKLWHGNQGDKGGFIQQATGWKPSILQPFVALESLLQGRNTL